ncbi:MAG: UvrD-helicase domain-containing protein [Victivallaceae bacterium]|nr:UvrD-helicase domain-containing protein [Victivallaceae bacterium]
MTSSRSFFCHRAIMASAGTGKTFQLAMRYIGLLEAGVRPGEIAALTFTNKAAGEIMDKIVTQLAELAVSPEKLRGFIADGLLPEMPQDAPPRLLRTLLSGRDRPQIGTLDSFFLRIIQGFPFECGIAGAAALIDEGDDRPRRNTLLELIVSADRKERDELRELVKEVSFGVENRSLYQVVSQLCENIYHVYRIAPKPELWQDSALVWPDFDPGWILKGDELELLHDSYAPMVEARLGDADSRLLSKFYALAEALVTSGRRHELDKEVLALLEKLTADGATWIYDNSEKLDFSFARGKYTLSGEPLAMTRRIVRHLAAVEFARLRQRTLAAYDLMRRFDRLYGRRVRAAGKLTFGDVQFLLIDPKTGRAREFLTGGEVGERLDAACGHYLVDEFQDTSDGQWQVIENLIDEVVYGSADRFRSFFYVGDIKQSIYQWREGNPELFNRVLRRYAGAVEEKSMTKSFRSAPPVIEAVNQVFSFPSAFESPHVAAALERMEFKRHDTARKEAPGFAALWQLPRCEKKEELRLRAEMIRRVVRHIDPFGAGRELSVGVLVRTNPVAAGLADQLLALDRECRSADEVPLAVSIDGSLRTTDSAASVAFLELLKLAAHPGDPEAAGFVEMLELGGRRLDRSSLMERLKLTGSLESGIRDLVSGAGYVAAVDRFVLAFGGELACFDRGRLELLRDCALAFDRDDGGTIDEFLAAAARYKAGGSSIRHTVQFMTLHKSKGLDFDVVILPGPYSTDGIDVADSGGLEMERNADGMAEWIGFAPVRKLAPLLPPFDLLDGEMRRRAAYENCCLMYVGMTRARHGLYMFATAPASKSHVVRMDDLLLNTLHGAPAASRLNCGAAAGWFDDLCRDGENSAPELEYAVGAGDWFENMTSAGEKKAATSVTEAYKRRLVGAFQPEKVELVPPRVRERLLASKADDAPPPAAWRFADSRAAELGTALHEFMAHFGFADDGLPEVFPAGEAGELLRGAFAAPEFCRLLSRNSLNRVELWREKRFLAGNSDGNVLSGTFDRVQIEYDSNNLPAGAVIIDYKSDADSTVQGLRERHSTQLRLYRYALSRLIGLDEHLIACRLAALRGGAVVEID